MSIPSGSLVKWGGASLRKQQVARYRYTRGEWSPSAGSIMPETVPLDLTVVSWNLGYFQGASSQVQVKTRAGQSQSLGKGEEERKRRSAEAEEVARAVVLAIRKHLRGRRKSSVSSSSGPNSGINNASKGTGSMETPPTSPTSPISFHSTEMPPSQGTIILLQQVHHVLFTALLRIDYLRENFRVIPGRIEQSTSSSTSDETTSEGSWDSFAGLWPSSSPFGNVTLISRKLSVCQANSFVFHNSITRRNALIVDLEMYDPGLAPPVPPKPPLVTTLGRSSSTNTSPTFSPSAKPETSISGKSARRTSVSSTTSSGRSQKVVRVINAHLEPSILSKGSDKETRKDQILLVKGCLSELGVYAAIGTASVGHVEEKWFRSGRNGPEEPAAGEKSHVDGVSGDNSHPKQEEQIEPPEEVTLARKLWARGPVGLENPHEIALRAALPCSKTEKGTGGTLAVGVGIAHHVKVT